jgi:hypothetical protein
MALWVRISRSCRSFKVFGHSGYDCFRPRVATVGGCRQVMCAGTLSRRPAASRSPALALLNAS